MEHWLPVRPTDAMRTWCSIQTRVYEFITLAEKSPAKAPADLAMLKESLDAYAQDFGGGFIQLRDAASELERLYASSAGKSEIDAQLKTLKSLAGSVSSPPQ